LSHSSQSVVSSDTLGASRTAAAHDRPDVFVSYAREDKEFVDGLLTPALVAGGKDVWLDVEDIRGGASDWRASVWAGIESAKAVVFVLTPDSLVSKVCGEELQHADELNKRIIPVLRRSVDGLPVPPALARPNWILARAEDDYEASAASLIEAVELDEDWVEQHARLTQRTAEWLRHDRDASYLLRGSDLRHAEEWLDDQGAHQEAPTAEQITYITASRRAAARRQRSLLTGVGLALAITAVLAVLALLEWRTAVDRERTARAQARAAQSIAALSRDPEESLRDALAAVEIRPDLPEATFALRRAVSVAGWTRLIRPGAKDVSLQDVEFSDDGRRVATGGADRTVAVWDTRSGRVVTAGPTSGAVRTIQFDHDGSKLLTASEGGRVQIWNSSTGDLLQALDTKDAWAATWGAGGRRILTATPRGGEIWNAADGRLLRTLRDVGEHHDEIRMSLDGRRALTAADNGAVWFWNLATRERRPLPGPNRYDAVAFSLLSTHGRRLAAIYRSGALCLWDDGRRSSRRCVPRTGETPTDGDLSRDGRRVLRVDRNGVVEVWSADSQARTPIARFANGGPVSSAQFDRTGEYVVTGSDDGSARVWRVKPTRRVALLRGHTRGVRRARFSPNGTQVATVSDDGTARLWPARPRTSSSPAWQRADSTSFSPNSRDVLLVRGQRRAIWNTGSGEVVNLQYGGGVMPSFITWPCGHAAGCSPWSPAASREKPVVAGADAKGAVIWDPATGHVVRQLGEDSRTVLEVAFSSGGRRVVVVDGNRSCARIWNAATWEPQGYVPSGCEARQNVPGKNLQSAQFVAHPLRVLTVDELGQVELTALATGKTIALPGAALPPAVAAASDGGHVAVGTMNGKLSIFSRTGAARPPKQATDKAVNGVRFNPKGTAIVTGGQSGTTTTWDVRTLTPTELRAFGGEITGAAFSPRGDLLLVTSGVTARLWDLTLRRVVVELPHTADVRAEFSPDGRKIVIAGKSRLQVVSCWACLPLKQLEERARALLPAS
jgi:WD40 repeat protein